MISFAVSIVPFQGNWRATARIEKRTLDFVEIRQTRTEALLAILETVKREIP